MSGACWLNIGLAAIFLFECGFQVVCWSQSICDIKDDQREPVCNATPQVDHQSE